jgi:hypothetical protein
MTILSKGDEMKSLATDKIAQGNQQLLQMESKRRLFILEGVILKFIMAIV